MLSIVPAGFAAYARVYHPIWHLDGLTRTAMRWAAVARANNRTAHRRMQWPSIIGSYALYQTQTLPFVSGDLFEHPAEGSLPPDVARPLWRTLAAHTTTPDRCWFAVWEGFGCLRADVRSAPAFDIPNRQLHLFSGPIQAIEATFGDPSYHQSANLWWPEDRAWCVATEIDFVTTYIAGSRAAIAAVVGHAELESDEVESSDGVAWASDTINPAPEGKPF